jgi:serine phosphatase RsbU (regulator of sigma subunit)
MLVRMDEAILANELRTEVGVVVALGLLGGLALILAGGFAFLWLINRPLSRMLQAIERFERHDDPQRVGYRSADEIGRVVASYNAMLDREVERVTEIREAHREIVDSVTYATRIQQGLLPTPEQCAEAFGDFAVIWQPRDLVGGDIYWVRRSGAITTVAVIDCTGHGVPGGFMTMLAIATLERIFAEDDTLTPGEAMSRLSDLTRMLLNQDQAGGASNDGMDAAMCRIDVAAEEMVFAGARLSMLLANGGQVQRIRGDRISLGYPDTPAGPRFTEHKLRLDNGATALIATDGLIDQLGGPKRRAFGYRRAMAELQAHMDASANDLIAVLSRAFEEYVGAEERLDDLTVLAFRPNRPHH